MNESELSGRKTSWFSIISLAIIIVFVEIPNIQRFFGGVFILVPFILMLGFSRFRWKITIKNEHLLLVFSLFYIFTIFFVFKVLRISTVGYGYIMHEAVFFTFFFSLNMVEGMHWRQKSFILAVIILSILFTFATNVLLYRRLGSYHYYLLHHISDSEELGNLANTQFSTAIVLMCGILLIAFINDRNTLRRLFWIGLFAVCTVFNFVIAQRMINIILSIMLDTLIIVERKKNRAVVYLLVFFLMMIFAVLLFNHTQTISFLQDLSSSSRLNSRLTQIETLLSTQDISEAGGSLSGRMNLIMVSIHSWFSSLRSFFFGVGAHLEDNSIIGNHSEFIDAFAKYGLIGGTAHLYALSKSIQILIEKLSLKKRTPLYNQTRLVLIIFFIRGFIGGVSYGYIGVQLFVFLPLVIYYIKKSEKWA